MVDALNWKIHRCSIKSSRCPPIQQFLDPTPSSRQSLHVLELLVQRLALRDAREGRELRVERRQFRAVFLAPHLGLIVREYVVCVVLVVQQNVRIVEGALLLARVALVQLQLLQQPPERAIISHERKDV